VNEVTVESPRESAALRTMAKFYFVTMLAIIFTGAVRKWLFPGVTVLYLLQDVPMALAYLYAIWTGLFTRGYILLGIILLSVFTTLQTLVQIIVLGLSPFVAVVGLHNYLFYLPILVVFPLCLTEKVRKKFVWMNLILSVPMCVVAILQAQSPKSAWINRTSEGEAFGLPGVSVARVSGTFNFTVFYGVWVAFAVALCMGEWLLPKDRRAVRNQWLLILCTFSVNICHLVSGSRSAIALAGAAVLGGVVAAIVMGSARATMAIVGICLLLPVAAAATYFISPDEFNTVQDRFTSERGVSSSKDRLSDSLVGFLTIPQFSLIGAGVGMGVDAAHAGNAETYNFTYSLSEDDLIRTVMELGTPVGLPYALIRIFFVTAMIILSVRLVRSGSSPHVLPLSFFLFAQTYIGDLTRAATMTASQVMVGYAFILGAYYHPDDTAELEVAAGESLTRSV